MIKVLKQWLEALEISSSAVDGYYIPDGKNMIPEVEDAITSLRQAIAELESQEPVAWMTINEYGEEDDIHYENPEGHLLDGWTYKPLYTTPQPVQEESLEPFEYWNAVEGWVKIDEVRKHFGSVGCSTIYKTAGEDRIPLYPHPPQRTWVGLTEDDKALIKHDANFNQFMMAGEYAERVQQLTEARLKDKNT